ncbi:hypothetical protein ACWEO2_33045 [Nocardia sp. NPDC004278]
MKASTLHEDYAEILAVLAESGGGLRAGRRRAGYRSVEGRVVAGKVKRLVARGRLEQEPSGVFTIVE